MVKREVLLLLILFFFLPGLINISECYGQPDYNSLYYYRFYLKDKGGADREEIPFSDVLSAKSLDRRTKNGITLDFYDLPVHSPYGDTLKNRGLDITCRSKWLNTITASSLTPIDIPSLLTIPFIDSIVMVKSPPPVKGVLYNKILDMMEVESPPPYTRQLEMHGGDKLHSLGARGKGKIIAILDGGFTKADMMESVSKIFSEGRVLSTYDFVLRNEDVYNNSQHGSAVFSIMGGDLPGQIIGSAPEASYLLLRTEDGSSEYLIEEDFWVAAAEYADSAGADIITTSLGYSIFSDNTMNHSYSEMDGVSIFISRGADIAFSRGIVVVTSAGNERDDPWYYITAPADAREIIACGAIDANSEISSFSSSGPSYDLRVKPDVSTMGVAVTIQRAPGFITAGNGTSYSCPLLSGMIACLMELIPSASHLEIREAVKISADRYLYPDNLYGYGVANIYNAYNYLYETKISEETRVRIYPNPTQDRVFIRVNRVVENLSVRIFDASGRLVIEKLFNSFNLPIIDIPEFAFLDDGLYIINLSSKELNLSEKVVKLKK